MTNKQAAPNTEPTFSAPEGTQLMVDLTPEQCRQHLDDQIAQLGQEILKLDHPAHLVVPLDGGLFFYAALMDYLREAQVKPEQMPELVCLAKIPGTKTYEVDFPPALQGARSVYVLDDIFESGTTFTNVANALAAHNCPVTPQFRALTRKANGVTHNGWNDDGTLVLPDEWALCGAGMNSDKFVSLKKTDPLTYAQLVAYERLTYLFLMMLENSSDAEQTFLATSLQEYMATLQQHCYFPDPEMDPLFNLLVALSNEASGPMSNIERFYHVRNWDRTQRDMYELVVKQ